MDKMMTDMIRDNDYKRLAEKYWDGTTSRTEEESLLDILRQASGQGSLTQEERALLLMLDGAAAARASHKGAVDDESRPVTPSVKRRLAIKWWIPLGSAAAVALTVWLSVPGLFRSNDTAPGLGYNEGEEVYTEAQALRLAEEALSIVAYDPAEDMEW